MRQQDDPLSLEQLRALNSPVRLQIISALRAYGPATVGELAERLLMKEHLLFYHVKVLVQHDLVFADGTRPSATKPVTVFRAYPPGSASRFDYHDPGVREQVKRNLEAVLRTAKREFEAAMTERPGSVDADASVIRLTTRLSPARHAAVREKLDELRQLLHETDDESEVGYSFTVVLTPLA